MDESRRKSPQSAGDGLRLPDGTMVRAHLVHGKLVVTEQRKGHEERVLLTVGRPTMISTC